MGVWNGFECINLCADTYTKSRMHVDVPSMWYYGMPYTMFCTFRENHVNERLAYRHIPRVSDWPMSDGSKQRFLAFLGLDD